MSQLGNRRFFTSSSYLDTIGLHGDNKVEILKSPLPAHSDRWKRAFTTHTYLRKLEGHNGSVSGPRMETQRGLLKKLGIFGGIAIAFFVVGKKHIASVKDKRHRKETDARVDSESEDFGAQSLRPGFPQTKASSEFHQSDSKYVGSGLSYSTRQPGDRLSLSAIFRAKSGSGNDRK